MLDLRILKNKQHLSNKKKLNKINKIQNTEDDNQPLLWNS